MGVARRLAPDPVYQLRSRPIGYLREYWGAFRSPALLARWLGRPRREIDGYWRDLIDRDRFYERIRAREQELTLAGRMGGSPGGRADAYSEVLYVLLRAIRPEVVVETGVALGYSSAYLLQALHDNGTGHLHSIDLPTISADGRVNADGVRDRVHVQSEGETGAVVPDDLRDRWTLTLGPSNPLLTELLERLGRTDVFFHDSDHSYENMTWEYRTAWPHLPPGGWLLSDDVHWNAAFPEFTRTSGGSAFRWFGARGHRGAIQKPPARWEDPEDLPT
jgi:predicted O-methyltransferase YrrM